jgi:hypothetical protein
MLISFAILYGLLLAYLALFKSHAEPKKAERALIVALALFVLSLIPFYLGSAGWLIAAPISLAIISRVLGEGVTASLLIFVGISAFHELITFLIFAGRQ